MQQHPTARQTEAVTSNRFILSAFIRKLTRTLCRLRCRRHAARLRRESIRELQALNDHMLADIGVRRDDIGRVRELDGPDPCDVECDAEPEAERGAGLLSSARRCDCCG